MLYVILLAKWFGKKNFSINVNNTLLNIYIINKYIIIYVNNNCNNVI